MSLAEAALILMRFFFFFVVVVENKDDAFSFVFIVDLAPILR